MKNISLYLTVLGVVIGLVSLIIALRSALKVKGRKMKKLSAEERIVGLSKILCRRHDFVLNLDGSAFIFMPNGEIIFGAGWVNHEWLKLLNDFVEKHKDRNIRVASVGGEFYLSDLLTGDNVKIPLDPQKGMTIDKDGVAIGHLYIFTKY
jgi:hypothetical protein